MCSRRDQVNFDLLILYNSASSVFWYRLWHKGLNSDLPEKEMMTQLLAAFKIVKGFEDRAKQLAEDYGKPCSYQG